MANNQKQIMAKIFTSKETKKGNLYFAVLEKIVLCFTGMRFKN